MLRVCEVFGGACQALIDDQVADDAPLGQVVQRCAFGTEMLQYICS